MSSNFLEIMKKLSESNDKSDQELVNIVNENSNRTRIELEKGTKDNEKFKQYLMLQSQIAANAEKYLTNSRTSYEKFKSLMKNPSSSGLKRIAKSLTFGLYKPEITPGTIGDIVLDLYNNQVEHLGAVTLSHDLLQNRRKLIYGIARDAAESIKNHSYGYRIVEVQFSRIDTLNNILTNFQNTGNISLPELLTSLNVCNESSLYDGTEIIERIKSGDDIKSDLYLVKADIDLIRAELKDKYRGEGLEVKGGITLLQGLELQKNQFDATIEAMGLQKQELEIDLRYTKEIARNTFYLMKAQDVSQTALDSFMAYRKTLNDVQVFNSLGARVMLDRVGFLMTTPFFDPEKLEQARDELRQGIEMYQKKEQQFHAGLDLMVKTLDLKYDNAKR